MRRRAVHEDLPDERAWLNRLLSQQAEDEAKRFKDDFISVEHLLLAMIDDTGTTGRLHRECGPGLSQGSQPALCADRRNRR